MITRRLSWMAAGLALVAGATLGQAADKEAITLKVGDTAPKLQVAKWVQGDPVKSFDKDKAYIVEFWATWCGPCRVSIPHLNEIHAKFKDKGLVVIGQDCWERDESLVAPFIKKMGEKMTYRVALDDKAGSEKGKMAETWMEAAGANGIPTAFVVNKEGKIAWIGHPMSLEEKLLEEVLEGTFDVNKAAEEYSKAKENEEQMMSLSRELSLNLRNKKWDDAEATLAKIEKVTPAAQRGQLGIVRFNILIGKQDDQGAARLAGKLSDENKDNAMLQNQLAWELLTNKGIKERDLAIAEKIAVRANDAAKGKDANILDTLARALFVNGKKDRAIELQKKAVDLTDPDSREKFQETLNAYKQGKVPDAD